MESHKDQFYKHIAQTSDAPIGLEIEYADGPFLFTTDGNRFIDFISGIAVSTLGHRHPDVIKAIRRQSEKHLHVMVYGEFIQRPQSAFAALIASQLPEKLKRIYFVNSGTEANEGALKLARKHTGRTRLFAFKNSYHGDTMGSLSVTGRDVYRDPYLPLIPDVVFFDFNGDGIFPHLDETVAAVIMEPVQGEGGIIPANEKWLKRLRDECSQKGILLIFDEIQSGFGRTGKLFAFEHYGVVPDILTMAKAMGGGLPVGGFASSDKIFESFMYNPALSHVTTFGGHPMSCAAGHAALRVLLDDNWMARAPIIEEKIRSALNVPGVKEVRGMGAMLGLEMESAELTQRTVSRCFDKGLLLGWTLHSDKLIRLAPPLTIPFETLDEALGILKDSIIGK